MRASVVACAFMMGHPFAIESAVVLARAVGIGAAHPLCTSVTTAMPVFRAVATHRHRADR
jgi:hypothetical protein